MHIGVEVDKPLTTIPHGSNPWSTISKFQTKRQVFCRLLYFELGLIYKSADIMTPSTAVPVTPNEMNIGVSNGSQIEGGVVMKKTMGDGVDKLMVIIGSTNLPCNVNKSFVHTYCLFLFCL